MAPKLVGQEVVTLSTTPAWINGKLTPRPMSLRVYVARTRDGWQVMPGGFARIGSGADAAAIAMQAGGSAADVWIVSQKPVEQMTLLPAEESFIRIMPGSLPSRAADNLFWLGRYIERAEGALRILRAWHGRFAETADTEMPLLKDITDYLAGLDIDTKQPVPDSLMANLNSALFFRQQYPRPLLRRWLAGAERSRQDRPQVPVHGSGRRRRHPCDDHPVCASSRALPVWCTKTCTASPAGASCRSAAISNAACT